MPRAPRATWPRKMWCTCCTAWASRRASTSDRLIEVDNWISYQLGRPSRSKVALAITRKRDKTMPYFEVDPDEADVAYSNA